MSRDSLAIARLEAEQRQARYAAELQRLAERLRVTPQKAEEFIEVLPYSCIPGTFDAHQVLDWLESNTPHGGEEGKIA